MGTHTGGGSGAGTKQRQSVTAGSILKAAARRLLPAGREDMIGDSIESSRLERFPEFYYPALAVRVDNPSPVEVRRRIDRTYRSLCRSLYLFTYASGILGLMNAHLLPDVYHLHFFFTLTPPLLLGCVKVLNRAGFEGGKPQLGMTGIFGRRLYR